MDFFYSLFYYSAEKECEDLTSARCDLACHIEVTSSSLHLAFVCPQQFSIVSVRRFPPAEHFSCTDSWGLAGRFLAGGQINFTEAYKRTTSRSPLPAVRGPRWESPSLQLAGQLVEASDSGRRVTAAAAETLVGPEPTVAVELFVGRAGVWVWKCGECASSRRAAASAQYGPVTQPDSFHPMLPIHTAVVRRSQSGFLFF